MTARLKEIILSQSELLKIRIEDGIREYNIQLTIQSSCENIRNAGSINKLGGGGGGTHVVKGTLTCTLKQFSILKRSTLQAMCT